MAALRLDDVRRELHPVIVLVSGKDRPDCNISEDVVRKSRLYAFDEVLLVDDARHAVLADRHRDRAAVDSSLVAPGDLEESVRGQRDLNQPRVVAPVTNDVLNHLARNWSHAALTGGRIERTCASASWREIHVAANRFLPHRRRSVVHGGDVLRQLESRPRCTRARRLPNSEARAGARILNGLEIRRAHGAHRRGKDVRSLSAGEHRNTRQRRNQGDAGPKTGDRRPRTGVHAYFQAAIALPCAEPGPNWNISILTPAGSVAFATIESSGLSRTSSTMTPRCFNAATYAFKSATCSP